MHSIKRKLPPLNALKIFESAARHSSFKEAAEENCITQSAVSRQIQLLESYYETPLFLRKNRKVELTDDAIALYKVAAVALDNIATASNKFFDKKKRGFLCLATTTAFSTLWLLPRLSDFRNHHPDIQLHLVTSEASPLLNDSIDIAITLDKQDTPGCPSTELFSEEIFPVCSPLFLEQHPELKTVENLASVPLLSLDRGHWKFKKWPAIDWNVWFQQLNINVEIKDAEISFNHFPLVIEATKNGLGVGMGWKHLVEPLLEKGTLVRLTEESLHARDRKHYLVVRDDLSDSPEVAAFTQWILDQTASLRE